jgi:hypothetical protein
LALGRESKRTGRTRSQLIREAIGARYLHAHGAGDLEAALLETAGAWKGSASRPTGEAYVEGFRRGTRLSAALKRRGGR